MAMNRQSISVTQKQITYTQTEYELNLDEGQAAQFAKLESAPDVQEQYLHELIANGEATMTKSDEVTESSVTEFRDELGRHHRVANSEFQKLAETIGEDAACEYGYEIVYNEWDSHLGVYPGRETHYASSMGEAMEEFLKQARRDRREVTAVFPPKGYEEELDKIPGIIRHDDAQYQIVPTPDRELDLEINADSSIVISTPEHVNDPISVSVRVGDLIVGSLDVTPEMLEKAEFERLSEQSPSGEDAI